MASKKLKLRVHNRNFSGESLYTCNLYIPVAAMQLSLSLPRHTYVLSLRVHVHCIYTYRGGADSELRGPVEGEVGGERGGFAGDIPTLRPGQNVEVYTCMYIILL